MSGGDPGRDLFVWMAAVGALGGAVNMLRRRSERVAAAEAAGAAPKPVEWATEIPLQLGLALMAVLTAPLFLSLVDSALLAKVFAPVDGAGEPASPARADTVVFLGLCVVAALGASGFIDGVSKRVLALETQAKKAARLQARVAGLERALEERAEQAAAASPEPEARIVRAIERRAPLRRTRAALLRDAAFDDLEEGGRVLDALVEAGVVARRDDTADGAPRYSLGAPPAAD